jgi:succinoglycan biosynthesis transport protein ExoP
MSELEYPVYESSEVSAREVIQLLRRRRWTVLGTLALFVVTATVVTPLMTPVYRARATMLVQEAAQQSPGQDNGDILRPSMDAAQPMPIDTQVEELQSGPLWDKVLDRIRPFPRKAAPSLNVAQRSKTNIIEVTVESTDPRVARDAPNTLVRQYIEQTKARRGAALRRTREFVQTREDEARQQLAAADARLRLFKEQNNITDLNSNREDAIKAASSMSEELRTKENELTSLHNQIREIQTKLLHEGTVVKGSFTILANPERDHLQGQIQTLDQQRISLLEHLKPDQPEVRTLDAQIARLRQRLAKQPLTVTSGQVWNANPQRAALMTQLNTYESQASGLEPQVKRLRGQRQAAENRLVTFPAWETRLAQLQRDRDQAQENQNSLNIRLRDLRIMEQAQADPASLMTEASLPHSPVRPQRSLNLLVAAALGLIFGVGAACMREMMDDRVLSPDDVERVVGLPILGRVPTFPRRAPMLISGHGESPAKESYRRLRAGISFATRADAVRSLMVTSATPGEGKSTTAANLALAATLQGKRVILVDADMRNPSLHPLVGVSASPGLSDLLMGEVSLSEALHETSVPHLRLLPAGTPGPHAAELLAGPRMEALVQELADLADLVIFDSPPCLPVSDAEVLGSRVDAAVMVIGLGRTEKEAVRMARELLDQAHVRLLGAVMNRMKPGDQGYYYRYGSAYSGAAGRLQAASTATAVVPRSREALAGTAQEDHPA